MSLAEAESLASANKRIVNILRSAEEDGSPDVDSTLFESKEEQALFDSVARISEKHADGIGQRDYTNVLKMLSELHAPVDDFFDNVMVMTDDVDRRRNRLAQLKQLRHLFLDVADLSLIPTG